MTLTTLVVPGLVPGTHIHGYVVSATALFMDCRDKPGNDGKLPGKFH